jgi:hypothetical protein
MCRRSQGQGGQAEAGDGSQESQCPLWPGSEDVSLSLDTLEMPQPGLVPQGRSKGGWASPPRLQAFPHKAWAVGGRASCEFSTKELEADGLDPPGSFLETKVERTKRPEGLGGRGRQPLELSLLPRRLRLHGTLSHWGPQQLFHVSVPQFPA